MVPIRAVWAAVVLSLALGLLTLVAEAASSALFTLSAGKGNSTLFVLDKSLTHYSWMLPRLWLTYRLSIDLRQLCTWSILSGQILQADIVDCCGIHDVVDCSLHVPNRRA